MDSDNESTLEELDAFEAIEKLARGEARIAAALAGLRLELVTLGNCVCNLISAV